jgi:hypothetical protein
MAHPVLPDFALLSAPSSTLPVSAPQDELPSLALPLLATAKPIESPKPPGPADPAFVQEKPSSLNIYIKIAELVKEFHQTMNQLAEWQRGKIEGMEKEYRVCTHTSSDALKSRGNWTLGAGILGVFGKFISLGFSAPGDRKIVEAIGDQLGPNAAMHGLATARLDAKKGESDSRQGLIQTKLQKDNDASSANRELKEQLSRVLEEAKQAQQKATQPGQ